MLLATRGRHRGIRRSPPIPPEDTGAIPYPPVWNGNTVGTGTVTLRWHAIMYLWGGAPVSENPVSYYQVRRGTTYASVMAGAEDFTQSDGTSSLTYTFSGLTSGSTQFFSVTAHNDAGESDASIIFEVTIP